MYTLKLDWPAARTDAVIKAMTADMCSRPSLAAKVIRDLWPYRYVDATIKIAWSPTVVDGVERALEERLAVLETDLGRARDNKPGPTYMDVVHQLTQVATARHDIIEYRAAVAAVGARSEPTYPDEFQ